ncbi:MAG: hypothetical protein ABR501_06120 [Pyrinomonadaceae bacterium]
MNLSKRLFILSLSLILTILASGKDSTSAVVLPNPVLFFTGREIYTVNGKDWIRYRFSVDNLAQYPDELFAPAPDLPPCGTNTNSSRTWVDFYDYSRKRLYGFCALTKAQDLSKLWFAVEADAVPPSWVYIELTDRKTNTKYKSNLADTVE